MLQPVIKNSELRMRNLVIPGRIYFYKAIIFHHSRMNYKDNFFVVILNDANRCLNFKLFLLF